ncbi:hypothetical protein BGW42_002382 [Actinomortierella wolfii]|nr:hypothetical protein BGW42_002382 [Actinomortierella wolfii]
MNHEKFTQILRGNGQKFSQDDFITYDDVYNEWYSIIAQRMWKDKDPVISSNRWMETFEASDYFTYYNKDDRTLGMSTDNTILTGWLRALKAKMKEMFSTERSDYDYKPNAVITDQGNTEILAIKRSFPGVPIFYCAWHVLKAWEREIPPRLSVLDGLSTEQREEKSTEGSSAVEA